jgi:ribonucleoside-diphosphate reductase alpha chain
VSKKNPATTHLYDGSQLASEIKFYTDYARYIEEEERVENWEDSVERVMNMHRTKYKKVLDGNDELNKEFEIAKKAYLNKEILGSQRALQFGGAPMLKHEAKMFNCVSAYVDRVEFFQECMYWLLCGCGVGFSVQRKHVNKLPPLRAREKKAKTFVIPDSIEGWSDAIGVLISSYATGEVPFPEYQGHHVAFDYSKIRPKGSKISGGFKAPGPDGLRNSIGKIEELLNAHVGRKQNAKFSSIIAYDIVMHMSNAVLSGGVRRSATICLFSHYDQEMLTAKTGNWLATNPQRARSNNSAVLIRDRVTKEQFDNIMESVREYGEPGFVFTESEDIVYNPCVEIGMYPQTEEGESGAEGCNLVEINGSLCTTPEKFYAACEAASIMGTLQAGYTNFKYVSKASKKIFEREALIGVSVTGWTNNPDVLFDPEVQRKGAEIVKATNKRVADMIRINQAARTTCVKPSGNASVLLSTASGIHGEHAPMYFRNMQMNKDNEIAKIFAEHNPCAVEESVWNANGTDWIFSIPVVAKDDSLFKRDLVGVKQLELVKLTQQNWVEYGTNRELCVHPDTRHNVSNTIQVSDWDEVADYIYENRKYFAGISLLGIMGDKAYAQAPFTEVFSKEQLLEFYGDAALFASGLIVDGMYAFNNNLWEACDKVLFPPDPDDYGEVNFQQQDWVRRSIKFADNYFDGDVGQMTHCLKDIHNYHKWVHIMRHLRKIDWNETNLSPNYIEVDTLASASCVGGACEVNF